MGIEIAAVARQYRLMEGVTITLKKAVKSVTQPELFVQNREIFPAFSVSFFLRTIGKAGTIIRFLITL